MIAVMKQSERSRIDSDLLQTFLMVAEARNITRAADRLGRTQSAISVQIQKLEDVLSAKLFRREARGMTLTEAGEALLPAARRALGEIERIGDLFAKPLLGRVRVGIPEDYGTSVLEKVLATFAARHPGVEVVVRCGFSGRFPDAVKRGELDLAVHAADPNDRVGKLLLTEQTRWVAHPGLKLDSTEPAPLALFDRDCWWRDSAIAALNGLAVPTALPIPARAFPG
jgi:DNA-binding transcriptional LysR family regulator